MPEINNLCWLYKKSLPSHYTERCEKLRIFSQIMNFLFDSQLWNFANFEVAFFTSLMILFNLSSQSMKRTDIVDTLSHNMKPLIAVLYTLTLETSSFPQSSYEFPQSPTFHGQGTFELQKVELRRLYLWTCAQRRMTRIPCYNEVGSLQSPVINQKSFNLEFSKQISPLQVVIWQTCRCLCSHEHDCFLEQIKGKLKICIKIIQLALFAILCIGKLLSAFR